MRVELKLGKESTYLNYEGRAKQRVRKKQSPRLFYDGGRRLFLISALRGQGKLRDTKAQGNSLFGAMSIGWLSTGVNIGYQWRHSLKAIRSFAADW